MAWMNECSNELNEWMNEWMTEWMHEWNEWMVPVTVVQTLENYKDNLLHNPQKD